MKKRILSVGLVLCLCVMLLAGTGVTAMAAGETDTAIDYLAQRGIYKGDDDGNLNPNIALTRTELAVILTRLDFADAPDEWADWGEERFSDPTNRYNTFTDIPNWAMPFIEYCYQRGLMKGVTATEFDPQGIVTPQMACTVMLRYCGIAETDWSYNTAVKKAQSIGLAPLEGLSGDAILRKTVAVIIYRCIQNATSEAMPDEPAAPVPTTQPDTSASDKTTAMTIDEMKLEIVRLTNIERVKAGVPELEVLPELMDCAQLKANDMLANHYFGHVSPKHGSANDMVKALVTGYRGAGENINLGGKTPKEVIEGWIFSPAHYQNLVDARFTHIGIGIVTNGAGTLLWVQQLMIT